MEQHLPWTGGWRNAYAKAACSLGYICRWQDSGLAISRSDGTFLSVERPTKETKIFLMSDIIKQAELHGARQVRAKEKKIQEQAELFLEFCSRSAAGEPLGIILDQRREAEKEAARRHRPAFFSYMTALAATSLPMWGGLGAARRSCGRNF